MILCARSDYFHALITGGFKESLSFIQSNQKSDLHRIRLDILASPLRLLLIFLYSGIISEINDAEPVKIFH